MLRLELLGRKLLRLKGREEGRTEKRGHQAEHVREERDDLCDDEREGPRARHDADPSRPSDEGVRVPMVRVAEDAEEDEYELWREVLGLRQRDSYATRLFTPWF